jgi:hypothetical protein
MDKILDLLASETDGTCYTSFRYCADEELRLPTLTYDETQKFTIKSDRYGETSQDHKGTINLAGYSKRIQSDEPLFRYFLDGSRRTYKIDDIEINRRIYPIMAGQIGVACCERKNSSQFKCAELENNLVLSLPTAANPNVKNSDQFFNSLTNKINNTKRLQNSNIKFSKILSYSSAVQDDSKKYEHLGIATIQDEMVECEKKIVAFLHTKNLLNQTSYLIKDGSLQYKPMKSGDFKELTKFRNHYRCVIGVSKLFNPELCQDKSGKSNADKIARMELYHRTPAYMYKSEMVGNINFAIWYVRIRETKKTEGPFAGILKIEKILITDDENENGLDTAEVDLITANIINERNPVCYGKDSRWANHLYPIYFTENFIKSKYLSDIHFINLF